MSKGREKERTSVCSRLVNSFDWIALGEWVGGAYETQKVICGGLAKQGWQLRLSSIHGSHESEQ